MRTTTMSSTTAPTVSLIADAPLLENCEETKNILEELFGPGTSGSNTGSISSTISLRTAEKLYTLKSPGESGDIVVKMEIYPFHKVVHMDVKDWWKAAELRAKVALSSNSAVAKLVMNLKEGLMREVGERKDVEKTVKEIPGTGFSFGYKTT